ncbi:MAG: ribosomal L7Ae/L30e/S12e/Gadd45 family protein [Candidatus Cloacimonetes bacterium]|nr:ribosomal L7Ae/L30e/S12e/Gadd45 family protein [Candidatus Cloacimonadota bacterium]
MDTKKETMVEPETEKQKVISLLQLARKAGKLGKGFDSTIRSCRSRKAFIVLIAKDLSESSRKRVLYLTEETGVPVFEMFTKSEMSELFDSQEIGILSVNDVNFAQGLKKYLHPLQ